MLRDDADVSIVAHCRHENLVSHHFADIAVIQTNKKTGATCFYQSPISDFDLSVVGVTHSEIVRPPSGAAVLVNGVATPIAGTSVFGDPSSFTAHVCVQCHDNGALIRSPYLTQMMATPISAALPAITKNVIPGAGDFSYNKDQPYFFPGNDFAQLNAYKVEITGNTCTGCHRMGSNSVSGTIGTGGLYGLIATRDPSLNPSDHKNPLATSLVNPQWDSFTKNSLMWMTPDHPKVASAANSAAAAAIHDCSARQGERPLPIDPSTCKLTQLSRRGLPGATGSPAGYAREDGFSSIVYRASSNHIFEMYRDQIGWHQGDLSLGATLAASSPSAWRRADHIASVLYRSADNHIRELYQNGGGWGAGDVSVSAGATAAAALAVGTPTGYVRADGGNAIVYRAADNHVKEIYAAPGSGWSLGDISSTAGALTASQLASGDAVGFVRSDGASSIVYRSADNHIRGIYLAAGASWVPEDPWALSGAPSTALAVGNPSVYVRSDGISAIVYRSSDGNIHELALLVSLTVAPGGGMTVTRNWAYGALTQNLGAPLAASDPSAFVRSDTVNSITYRATNGDLRELTLNDVNNVGWQSWLLYAQNGVGTNALTKPFGFIRADMMDSVIFETSDTHIRELSKSNTSSTAFWQLSDLTVSSGNTQSGM